MSSSAENPSGRPQDRTAAFQVGSADRQGRRIEQVYCNTNEYVVYRTDIGIRLYTADEELPAADRVHFRRFLQISTELARIYSLQPEQLSRVESINRQIARAIILCVEGEIDSARVMLADCEQRLVRLRRLEGRLQYLKGTAAILAIIITLFIPFRLYADLSNQFEPNGWMTFAQVITCGALGGYLSVAIGLRKLDIDIDADRSFNILAGASRLLIAAVASVFMFFAVKANVALGMLDLDGSEYGVSLAAMIAGFSESLVPNIVRRISEERTE